MASGTTTEDEGQQQNSTKMMGIAVSPFPPFTLSSLLQMNKKELLRFRRRRPYFCVLLFSFLVACLFFLFSWPTSHPVANPNPTVLTEENFRQYFLSHCNREYHKMSRLKIFDSKLQDVLAEGVHDFHCFLAGQFNSIANIWKASFKMQERRGIITSAGSPYSLANAFVNLYTLRHLHNCTLPFTIMFWGDEEGDKPNHSTVAFIKERIPNVSFMDLSLVPYPSYQLPLQRDGEFNGWKVKIFALYAAPYQEIIYLDSDNLPLRDPTFLFQDQEYQRHGSLFWPDLYCGSPGLHKELKMPLEETIRQTESGQFVLNRSKHWLVLEWLLWLNTRDEVTYSLSYGDKDTFKAAFFLGGKAQDFVLSFYGLGLALYKDWTENEESDYPLKGFVQFSPDGSALFMHRVSGHKYNPELDQEQPVNAITVPSCWYFSKMGWDPKKLSQTHLNFPIYDTTSCDYTMEDIHGAALRCSKYNSIDSSGSTRLPIFKIPSDSYVANCLKESDNTFKILRHHKMSSTMKFFAP